jgi:glycosyltransferase involved in cell wall biosynthesis
MSLSRCILYIDLAPAVGGSIISLYHLVRGLDRERYQPVVVLRASNAYAARFRALGVQVFCVGSAPSPADPTSAPPPTWQGVRGGPLAGWLKKSQLGERLVHGMGFWLRDWPRVWREARELHSIMLQVRPDLVHLNDVVCVSRAGILAARWARLPAICHLRAMAWRNHFDRWNSTWLRGYICISQAVEQHQRRLGGRIEPTWVIYNGLEPDEFADGTGRAAVRAELGYSAEQFVVGCVGRLVAWKGQEVFLQALARLAPQYPQLRGLIVGAPEAQALDYAARLRTLVVELGLERRVQFIGFRSDVARLLSGMDLLVHASVAPEPFGRVIIEGMAAGLPVVGTRAGAVPEIVQDGVNGRLVAPGDVSDMAQAIEAALTHPDLCRQWAKRARQTVQERFTTTRYLDGVVSVYGKILNDQSG